jgi:hypothetical protein
LTLFIQISMFREILNLFVNEEKEKKLGLFFLQKWGFLFIFLYYGYTETIKEQLRFLVSKEFYFLLDNNRFFFVWNLIKKV